MLGKPRLSQWDNVHNARESTTPQVLKRQSLTVAQAFVDTGSSLRPIAWAPCSLLQCQNSEIGEHKAYLSFSLGLQVLQTWNTSQAFCGWSVFIHQNI